MQRPNRVRQTDGVEWTITWLKRVKCYSQALYKVLGAQRREFLNPPEESGKPYRERTFGIGSSRISMILADRKRREIFLPTQMKTIKPCVLPIRLPKIRQRYRYRYGLRNRYGLYPCFVLVLAGQ